MAGRPVKYKTPEEMQKLIDKYFADCKANRLFYMAISSGAEAPEPPVDTCTDDEVPTVSGLAVVLDLTRQGLIEYGGKEIFSDTVKKAKARIEAYSEQRLHQGAPTGMIFSLKNNFGWKDKTEQEVTGAGGGPMNLSHTITVVGAKDGRPADP